jgi:hypothetical protein
MPRFHFHLVNADGRFAFGEHIEAEDLAAAVRIASEASRTHPAGPFPAIQVWQDARCLFTSDSLILLPRYTRRPGTDGGTALVRPVRESGSTEPGKMGGRRKPLLAGHEDLLRELTATRKRITLAEIRDALIKRGIQSGSLTTIWETLRRLGLTQQKRAARGRVGAAGRG